MDRDSILQKFKILNLWQKGGKRAPHKPLLVLLAIGKLLRTENRLIEYSEIEEKLGNLLREFGPWKSSSRPEFPFWRLRNDGVWEVSDEDRIRETKSGDAYISDLRRYGVSGGFTEPIARCLRNDPVLAFEIIRNLLDAHFPYSIHEDILQAVGIEFPVQVSRRKKRDPDFREKVLKAYEYRCAVCGFDVRLRYQPVALEAAHIKWHQAGGPDTEVNGLALCVLHHKLFDLGAFMLSRRLDILVSDDAHGSVGFDEWLMRFHGKKINFPQRHSFYPRAGFIGWHVREVFKGSYRESRSVK